MRRKKRNKKVKKYNKFFSYNCTERKNKNFSYKDFGYSNSYNTRFTNSIFYGNSFYKATMKYCGFNGCKFNFIEFKSVNFRGCRFKGAYFENVIFENCNLSNTHFENATFKNVYLVNTSLKLSLTPQLLEAIDESKINPYIMASGTIFQKKKGHLSNAQRRAEKLLPKQEQKHLQRERQVKLLAQAKQMPFNKVNIIRLLDNFTECEVAQGLHLATMSIDKDFLSLSYFIPYIKKANNIN